MPRSILRVLFVLLFSLGLAVEAKAQFTANPGTGCAGPMTWVGTPTIGTTPLLHSPCPPGTVCVFILGTPIPCFNVAPLCPGCNLCCSLTFTAVFPAPVFALPIPNNTSLICVTGCMQMACPTTALCFKTSDSVSFKIQ